jgi:hypothetical protein
VKYDAENRKAFVTFLFWSSKWDAWIDISPETVAPLHTHTYNPPNPLKLRQRIEVFGLSEWKEAFVVDESATQVTLMSEFYSKSLRSKFTIATYLTNMMNGSTEIVKGFEGLVHSARRRYFPTFILELIFLLLLDEEMERSYHVKLDNEYTNGIESTHQTNYSII